MSNPALRNRSGALLARVLCTALPLFALGGGCAYGELRQVLRAQVASEADCPDVVVEKSPAFAPGYKDNQYNVRGCKIDRVYTCKNEGLVAFGSADCTYVNGGAAAAPAAKPAPSGDSGGESNPDDIGEPDL